MVRSIRPRALAVVGDVMLDRYIRGEVRRLSPEAPIQVLEVGAESALPGGAANVAMKAAELDARVRLVALVGDDAPAADLRALLAARTGLETRLIADPGRATTVKTRYIAHNQQLLRVDREHRARAAGPVLDALAEAAFQASRSADAVILEDYGKGVLAPEVIRAALDGARQAGAPVVVDPNGRDYRRYAGATILTPNLRETEVAADRSIGGEADLLAAAALLVAETGAALAVTREGEGISLFRIEGGILTHLHVPTVPVPVFDVTGAGDAVAATLAVALACGIEAGDACALANLAGRAVVRQTGVGAISIAHLLGELAEVSHRGPSKVVDLAGAVRWVREVRRGGGKVAFTNGCFDVLHFGHAHLLQFARAQADFLVLGLNSDDSVRRLKGPSRPYVDEGERSTMLSLYPFVDLVVLFDEDTPIDMIEALRPDVVVKGGDYTPETVVGARFVSSYGGRVAICPRLEGLSTTDLVRKIRRRDDEGRTPPQPSP